MHHITYKFFEIKASFRLWNCKNKWILFFHPTFLYLMNLRILRDAHHQSPASRHDFPFVLLPLAVPLPHPACSLSSSRKGKEGMREDMETMQIKGVPQMWALKWWGMWNLYSHRWWPQAPGVSVGWCLFWRKAPVPCRVTFIKGFGSEPFSSLSLAHLPLTPPSWTEFTQDPSPFLCHTASTVSP